MLSPNNLLVAYYITELAQYQEKRIADKMLKDETFRLTERWKTHIMNLRLMCERDRNFMSEARWSLWR